MSFSSRSRSCSASLRSVMSRRTMTAPDLEPAALTMILTLPATGIAHPDFESKTVLASILVNKGCFSRSLLSSSASVDPLARSRRWITSQRLRFTASSDHPLSASAAGFMNRIRPLLSVAINASPMLVRTAASHRSEA